MIYLDESLEDHIKAIFAGYVKINNRFTDDLLECHIDDYYSNNPLPIDQMPNVWLKVSNLLENHYEPSR